MFVVLLAKGLLVIICRKISYLCRSHSNFEEEENSESEDLASSASVEQVRDADEEIVTPPDNLVAVEIDAIENRATASKSNSSTSSKVGTPGVHIQKPRAKKMTETARQRQEMHTSFLNILQRDQERELRADDEIDSSFFGYASRMRLHLNQDQREDVLQEINKIVTEAINNVRAGLPVINRAPMFVPPVPPLQQQPQQMQQMAHPPMQTPAMQQMPNPQQMGNGQQQGQQYEYTYTQM